MSKWRGRDGEWEGVGRRGRDGEGGLESDRARERVRAREGERGGREVVPVLSSIGASRGASPL